MKNAKELVGGITSVTGVLALRRAERRGAILAWRNGSSGCFRRQNSELRSSDSSTDADTGRLEWM